MRKTTTKEDKIGKLIHTLLEECGDEMDRRELRGFIGSDNMPKIVEMVEDDRIDVEDVLVIGNYMTLNKLHHELHEGEDDELSIKLHQVMEGKMELREITPEDMPDEVIQALEGIVNIVRKKRSKEDK